MTDSNGDLVERVIAAFRKVEDARRRIPGKETAIPCSAQRKIEARAAIVTVLDDLMEPTEEMIRAGNMTGFKASVRTVCADVWQAMLDAKRSELGLTSPMEPGDAPNALEGTTKGREGLRPLSGREKA